MEATTTPTPSQLYGEFDLTVPARFYEGRPRFIMRVNFAIFFFVTAVGLIAILVGVIVRGIEGTISVPGGALIVWSGGSAALYTYRARSPPPLRLVTSATGLTLYLRDGSSSRLEWSRIERDCVLAVPAPVFDVGTLDIFELRPPGLEPFDVDRWLFRRPPFPVTYISKEAHLGIVQAAGIAGVSLQTEGRI